MTQLLTFPHQPDYNPWHAFSRYVDNLKKNYRLNAYCASLEIGETNGQYHFHCIMDMPFTPIERLRDAWCSARGHFSANAVRDVRYIRSLRGVASYAAKYAGKGKSKDKDAKYQPKDHKYRKYSESRNTHGFECREVSAAHVMSMGTAWSKTFDYCEIGAVKDRKMLNSFFWQVDCGFEIFM